MHPEVKTVLSVYGNCRVIPKSLDFVVSGMDDEWLYNIPTYSSWWIIVLKEWFVSSGDFAYIEKHRKTVGRLIEKITASITDDGTLQYRVTFAIGAQTARRTKLSAVTL